LLLVEDAQKTAVPNEMHQNSTRRGKLCDQVEYAIHEKKQPQATNVEHISDRAQNGFKANPQEASLKKPPKGVARQSTDNGDVQPSRQVEVNMMNSINVHFNLYLRLEGCATYPTNLSLQKRLMPIRIIRLMRPVN